MNPRKIPRNPLSSQQNFEINKTASEKKWRKNIIVKKKRQGKP